MVNSVKFNLPTEIPVTKQGKVVMINILHLLSLMSSSSSSLFVEDNRSGSSFGSVTFVFHFKH